jgi:hypothetical protein
MSLRALRLGGCTLVRRSRTLAAALQMFHEVAQMRHEVAQMRHGEAGTESRQVRRRKFRRAARKRDAVLILLVRPEPMHAHLERNIREQVSEDAQCSRQHGPTCRCGRRNAGGFFMHHAVSSGDVVEYVVEARRLDGTTGCTIGSRPLAWMKPNPT